MIWYEYDLCTSKIFDNTVGNCKKEVYNWGITNTFHICLSTKFFNFRRFKDGFFIYIDSHCTNQNPAETYLPYFIYYIRRLALSSFFESNRLIEYFTAFPWHGLIFVLQQHSWIRRLLVLNIRCKYVLHVFSKSNCVALIYKKKSNEITAAQTNFNKHHLVTFKQVALLLLLMGHSKHHESTRSPELEKVCSGNCPALKHAATLHPYGYEFLKIAVAYCM